MNQLPVRMPPEWHLQQWLWVGFPHDPVEWPGYLGRAQEQIAAFASARRSQRRARARAVLGQGEA
jgi:agmatine/peptidylarginine deiminase